MKDEKKKLIQDFNVIIPEDLEGEMDEDTTDTCVWESHLMTTWSVSVPGIPLFSPYKSSGNLAMVKRNLTNSCNIRYNKGIIASINLVTFT